MLATKEAIEEVDEFIRKKGRRANRLFLGEWSILANVCSVAKTDQYCYRVILAIEGIDSSLMQHMHPVSEHRPKDIGEVLYSDDGASEGPGTKYAAANFNDQSPEATQELVAALQNEPGVRVHVKAENRGTRFQINEIELVLS